MAQRPHEPVDILLNAYRTGLISRRRIMALAMKIPALAAALAAGSRMELAGASGTHPAPSPLVRLQDVPQGGELQMAYDVAVADTLNQHRSNFTVSRMVARHVLDCLTWVN
ncbi:MAG: hypothetical protein K0S78_6413, partial [Thermomicrobiales bacterium]|nr:hypothetical protein [Thermomicrobiales bacterium]